MPSEPHSDNPIPDAVAELPDAIGTPDGPASDTPAAPPAAATGSDATETVSAGGSEAVGQQGVSDTDQAAVPEDGGGESEAGMGAKRGSPEAGGAESVGKDGDTAVAGDGKRGEDVGAAEVSAGPSGGKGSGVGGFGGRRSEGAVRRGGAARTVSVSVSAIGVAVGVVVLAAALAVACFGWWSARDELDGVRAGEAGERHAEQVATDYAVGASTIDHQNVAAWVSKLKANTSPQLANKFDATAPKLEEILLPLKWTSTAVPIAAKVASVSGGVYKVNVFVDVASTNAQNPKGGQMTVTYNVTVDSNGGWQITDVGGLDGALPTR